MAGLSIERRKVVEQATRFRLEADAGWWDALRGALPEPALRLLDPFVLELEGHSLGRRLLFRGTANGAVELVCGRCAESYRLGFGEPVEVLLEPASETKPIPGGIELDSEEAGLGRYNGDELDFAPVLSEVVFLSWPMQPLCKEECLGLCSECGVNRNREPCRCDTGDRTRPFSALGGLLERLEREDTERSEPDPDD